ncbi:hypothetical protein VPH35_036740 [Triticum aestivum]
MDLEQRCPELCLAAVLHPLQPGNGRIRLPCVRPLPLRLAGVQDIAEPFAAWSLGSHRPGPASPPDLPSLWSPKTPPPSQPGTPEERRQSSSFSTPGFRHP